jgi:hypothetical protein
MEKSYDLDDTAFSERYLSKNHNIEYKVCYEATSPNLNSFLAVKASITAQNIAYFSNVLGIEASAASQYSFEL